MPFRNNIMSQEEYRSFINAVVKADKDAAREAFGPIFKQHLAAALGHKPKVVNESVKVKMLREMFEDDIESPIKILRDSSVVVNGKRVGVVQTDLEDFDSGINFITDDGKFSKEFIDVDALFKFLRERYLGEKVGVK